MKIRRTEPSDLDTVMEIYDRARLYMRQNGNVNQWTEGYPDRELIIQDMNNGYSHVCIAKGRIAAVFSFIMGTDPTYLNIYDGSWLNDEPYGVIHRIRQSSEGCCLFLYRLVLQTMQEY